MCECVGHIITDRFRVDELQVKIASDVESIRESVRERFAARIQGTRRGAEEDDSGIAFGESFAEKFGDQIPDVPPPPSAPPLTEDQRRRNAEWARVRPLTSLSRQIVNVCTIIARALRRLIPLSSYPHHVTSLYCVCRPHKSSANNTPTTNT